MRPHRRVRRATGILAGAVAVVLLVVAIPGPAPGLATGPDIRPGALHWTAGDALGSVRLDGTGAQRSTALAARAIAVADGGARWVSTDQGLAHVSADGMISVLVPGGSPRGVAVGAEHVYWADDERGAILRARLDGTGVQHVSSADGADQVALDPLGSRVYWTEPTAGRIRSAAMAATSASAPPGDVVASGLSGLRGLAVDATLARLVWSRAGARVIERARLDGEDVEQIAALADEPGTLALDEALQHVYVAVTTSSGSAIHVHPIGRDGSRAVVGGLEGPVALALELPPLPALWAQRSELSLRATEPLTLLLDAGPERAYRPYVVVAGASGAAPGVWLGDVHVPINADTFTSEMLRAAADEPGFVGRLDASGRARVELELPNALDPNLDGTVLHYAFVTVDEAAAAPLFASNALALELVD